MTDDKPIETHVDLTEVKPPPLDGLPDEVAGYIAYLETKAALLEAELENKAYSGEARGLAWTEVYGIAMGADGEPHNMKITVSQRSDVGSENAFRLLFNGLRAVKGDFKMTPFVQSLQLRRPPSQTKKGPKPPEQKEAENGPTQTEEYPA